jgi:Xaa-Pro aminopeptidase
LERDLIRNYRLGESKMSPSKERLANLQSQLRVQGVDLAAIGPTANMRYLLGFAPHADERVCLLLATPSDVKLVVPVLNKEEVVAHTENIEMVAWADVDGPQAALRQALGTREFSAVAFDGGTRADFLLALQTNVAGARISPADALIAPLRERKSQDEIDILAEAAHQADLAMQAAVNACRVGATEAEVAEAVEKAFRQSGAEVTDFTIVGAGANGAFPHHHSSGTKLKEGDAIVIDIGATHRGYKSDITRMVHLGNPSAEFTRAYNAVLDANQRAMAAVRPGMKAEEIDRIGRSVLESAGLGQHFTHRLGHGLGLDGHETPWIMKGNATVLQEGMVFSIEPGVYFPGKYGIRIEDIVVVTANGVRNLTGFDHTLVVIN